jgi:single-stranded-DNA-specific exonuclease
MKSSAAALRARAFLDAALGAGPMAIACDDGVDGLCAAVLLRSAFERKGGSASIFVGRPAANEPIGALPEATASLVVLDGESAASDPNPAGRPVLRLDDLRGERPDARASAGMLCLELVRGWAQVDDLEWLVALGTFAELGNEHAFAEMNAASQRWGSRHIAEAAALLNAARRAGDFSPEVAVETLAAAQEPADLLGTGALTAWRDDVLAEIERCMGSAPRFAGQVALLRFSSPAQVHPIVAARWIRRLKRMIVLAVNDGWLPGRISFALRSSDTRVDLLSFLRRASLVSDRGIRGLVKGHPRAAGGNLPPEDFERLLEALGFEAQEEVSDPRRASGSISPGPGPGGRRRREPA